MDAHLIQFAYLRAFAKAHHVHATVGGVIHPITKTVCVTANAVAGIQTVTGTIILHGAPVAFVSILASVEWRRLRNTTIDGASSSRVII